LKNLAVLLLLAAATPAAADWLVTRTGERVETRGPWRVKGKLVVFTRMDGTLASLRASELDLEASERATAEARAKKDAPAPKTASPEKKKPVAVVTDETLAKTRKPAAAPAAPAEPDARPSEEPAVSTGPAVLASWDRRELAGGNGIELFGTVSNPGPKIAAGVLVRVQLYDEAGNLVASAEGIPAQSSLSPQGTVEFRIPLPGIYSFAEAKLQVKSFELDFDPAPKEGETPE
jgi:pyruvate/2-oxoglutarate dehydrogenase complex dihydrolipoamide acyltransferase (E2) component